MKKKKTTSRISNFDQCRKCIYFPDISTDKYPYEIDKYGVKHRSVTYICQHDLHEINPKDNQCTRGLNGQRS